MKPIQLFLIIAISAYASWGLTLQEIQTRLLSQVPYKSPHKMLLEHESSILNLRTITTATKTKVIDLKTGTSQIISTPRRTLDSLQQLSTTVVNSDSIVTPTFHCILYNHIRLSLKNP